MAECYRCHYRSRVTLSCDYILIEGHSRGMPASCCTKFKQRKDEDIDPYVLRVQELYYKGYSDRRISRELGVSRYFVYTWRKSNWLEANGEAGRPKRSECFGL